MNDIMKIIQALEDSNIFPKGGTKTIKNETKEQIGGFLKMSLGTLGANLSGNLLAGKGILRAGSGNKNEKNVRAGSGNRKRKRNCKSWFWETMGFLNYSGWVFLGLLMDGGGGDFCPLFPKIRHTYPTMMKLGTVKTYLRKIQKMYKSRNTFLEFC